MSDVRESRKDEIYATLQEVGRGGLTMREIGISVGLRKTPYLRNLVWELVEEQSIFVKRETAKNGAEKFTFHDAAFLSDTEV